MNTRELTQKDFDSAPEGLSVSELKPTDGVAQMLIGPLLETVSRVTTLEIDLSNLLNLPLANIDIFAKGVWSQKAELADFEGAYRLVTLDLGEPATMIHPFEGTTIIMPREAAALIFTTFFCEAALQNNVIAEEGRTRLGYMFECSRAAAYMKHPDSAFKMLD